MQLSEEYRLSLYRDLGRLEDDEKIRLKRRTTDGKICVEKRVPAELRDIYHFLKQNHSVYIPRIYECAESGGELIIMEEYIEGRTLEEIVQEGTLSESEAGRILIELCRGLKPLHHAEPPIICRDLKPENIMLDDHSCVKIVDFNIARSFQEGKKRDTVLLGTAGYAAPEQFGFSQTDNRTDIYALGVLLNYLLTGQLPVDKMAEGKVKEIIQKCTHVDREKRCQSVEELECELEGICPNGEPQKDGNKDGRTEKAGSAGRKEERERHERHSFVPPGFRSGNPLHIISAVAGYLFMLWFSFTLEFSRDGKPLAAGPQWLERTALCVSLFLMVFIIWNYRGWKERIPFVNHQNIWIRAGAYIVIFFVILVAAVTVSLLLESILF